MFEGDTPAILLESRRRYYDIYLDEMNASKLKEGDDIMVIASVHRKMSTVKSALLILLRVSPS